MERDPRYDAIPGAVVQPASPAGSPPVDRAVPVPELDEPPGAAGEGPGPDPSADEVAPVDLADAVDHEGTADGPGSTGPAETEIAGTEETASDGTAPPDGDVVADQTLDADEADLDPIDAIDRFLDEVERALSRLDDGTYGQCAACGRPIDDAVLEASPTATTCGDCVVANL